jgi:hypothetical protein
VTGYIVCLKKNDGCLIIMKSFYSSREAWKYIGTFPPEEKPQFIVLNALKINEEE